MLSLNSILLFSEHPTELVAFYKEVFQKDPDWSGGDFNGFDMGAGELIIGPHSKLQGKNTSPERMMINLETDDVDREFKRIKELGAKVVAEPYHPKEEESMTIATLSDIDGNYFQLTSTME